MARTGPPPKDPKDRLRRNKAPELTLLEAEAVDQPELPETLPDGAEWPEQTIKWWTMWGRSPLTTEYTEEDWADLLDCAVLHARFWTGSTSVAPELRLRVSKHGITREDRARLRIQFATADVAETKRDRDQAKTKKPAYGDLKAV